MAESRVPSTRAHSPMRGGSRTRPLKSSVAAGAPSPRGCASACRTARDRSRNVNASRSVPLASGLWPLASANPNIPRLFEIPARIGAERRERLRPLDSLHRGEFLRDHFGDLLVFSNLHDDDQVPLAGHGVDLLDAVDSGEGARRFWNALRVGANQHDGGDHGFMGKGGTSSSQTPASRSRVSISRSMSRAMRTVRTCRPGPSLK